MSREIKFRAWDFFNERMWSHSEGFATRSSFFERIELLELGGNRIELMQFTGLHSKSGREIYEGDILKLANEEKIIVTFKSGKFIGIRKNGTQSNTAHYWKHSEIIGNQYETPELLTN